MPRVISHPETPTVPRESDLSAADKRVIREETDDVRVVDKRWWAQDDDNNSDEPRSTKPSFVRDLEGKLATSEEQRRSLGAKYKEAAAELENDRVRLKREIAKDVDREKRRVLATFLEIIDNLDRALEAGQESSSDGALLQGVEMIQQQFLDTLQKHQVSRIDATGDTFDPTKHDAISMVPVSTAAQDNIVIDVVKPGYRVGDEVLRPANVTVGKYEENPE